MYDKKPVPEQPPKFVHSIDWSVHSAEFMRVTRMLFALKLLTLGETVGVFVLVGDRERVTVAEGDAVSDDDAVVDGVSVCDGELVMDGVDAAVPDALGV